MVVVVAAVMCALGVSAQEAYAVYTSENTTLSFYYDNDRSTHTGTTYDLNNGPVDPGWVTDFTNLNVKQVVFDPSFAGARPTSTFYWFYGMRNLETLSGLEYLNTSEVTRMDDMFNRCYKLTSLNLEKFNLSKGTDLSEMFRSCTALQTIYVGDGWRLSEMAQSSSHNVFKDCTSLVGGKGTAYDAAHVDADYAHIDGGTGNPGYLSAGTMSYVCYTPENTTLTFYYDNQRDSRPGRIYDLNVGLNRVGWELDHTCQEVTNAVIDPSFADARPTTTYAWFYGMNKIDTIIGLEYLNTSEVTIMNWMFGHSNNLEHIDVSHFNTDKVTSMYALFGVCEKLKTLDLSNWNTANVTDMDMMFSFCLELKTIYVGSGWNTDCVTESEHMFANNFLLVGGQGTAWDASNPKDKTYAHIDGGTGNPGYLTDKFNPVAYAVFENQTLTFYYDFERNSRSGKVYELNTDSNFPAWDEDGITGIVNYAVFDPSFADARPTSTHGWFLGMQFLKSIRGLEYLNTSEVTNMGDMFNYCSQLRSIDLSHFNTEKVTFMAGMFVFCSKLKSLDLTSFNTSNVTNMLEMFNGCSSLETIYVRDGWSTAALSEDYLMFMDCSSLVGGEGTAYDANHVNASYAHIDGGADNPGYLTDPYAPKAYAVYTEDDRTLSFYYDHLRDTRPGTTFDLNTGYNKPDWQTDAICENVTKVVFDPSFADARPTTTFSWFRTMRELESIPGLRYLNTSEVTNMEEMFCYCIKLTSLDLSHFNTAKVTKMYGMFDGCSGLTTLDLSGFNPPRMAETSSMFAYCTNLRTIYGRNWDTSIVSNSHNMFYRCNSLVGGQGTTYDPNHIDKAYAHIDGGPDNPGYFTKRPDRGDVNGDGSVDIADVTDLIDHVLGKDVEGFILSVADVNFDGNVDIVDVTDLIDFRLSGTWN